MLCSLIALDDEVENQSLVEAFHVSAYSGRTRDNIIHLQCLSFWWSCISCKRRLHFCQVCREQLTGNCIGLPSVRNVAFMLKNWSKVKFLKWKFDCRQWNQKSMVEIKHTELNNSSHTFSFGLAVYFPHCPGTGVVGPLIWVLVKDHMDLQTIVVKEWGTEDFEIFFKELTKGICSTRFCHM